MSDAGSNRRDRAAAAKAEAQAGEKKRERMVRIVGGITVLIVVVGIIGVAVVAKNSTTTSSTPAASATADPGAVLPAGVLPAADVRPYGVPYNTVAGVPVLEIWEDFQCPACEAVETAAGASIQALADQGKIQLVYRPTTFLDKNLGNDSSQRAVAAWGCAIDAGKLAEYHNVIYKNPPKTEGDGFTDEQLIAFAGDAGITGADLTTFTKCFTDRTYVPWADNSASVFYASSISGTPFVLLNGVEVPTATVVDAPALEKLIADAAAGVTPSSAASPAASPTAS
jgi:protein-disulfide isomerase